MIVSERVCQPGGVPAPAPRQRPRGEGHRRLLAAAAACLLGWATVGWLAPAAAAASPLSKSRYDVRMGTVGVGFAGDLNAALAGTSSASLAATRVRRLIGELAGVASVLRSIVPPRAIRSEHARLIAAVAEFQRELEPIAASLRGGKLTLFGSIGALKGLRDVQSAVKAIDAAGYSIGG